MTDADDVREQLGRLARGEPVPPWHQDRTIERAAAAREDVVAAAAFAADGGCDRLLAAIRAAERDGDEERAARGRSALAAFHQFEAACSPDDGQRGPGACATTDDRAGSLPPRSRNP